MASTMSIRRQRAATSAIAFLDAHGDEIGSGVEQRLLPLVGEGEQPPDVKLTIKLVRDLMTDELRVVVEADQANIDEKDGDLGPRLELAEAAEEVQRQLVAGRRVAAGVYGAKRAQDIFALDGPTGNANQPLLLLRQGQDTVKRFRNATIAPPKVTVGGANFDPEAFADRLEPAVERLARAYNAVALERRKIEATVNAKAQAKSDFDTTFRAGVRVVVGLCLLGGKPELARRLTASLLAPPRRRDEPPTPAEDSSPADDSPPPPDADPGTEETDAS